MGAFNRKGLDIISTIWSNIEFSGTQGWSDAKALSFEMLDALERAGLISTGATNEQARTIAHSWQMPMYNIDFTKIDVTLEELQDDRDAAFMAEFGDWP